MEILIILVLLIFFVTKFLFFDWRFVHCFYINRKRKGLKIRFFKWLSDSNNNQKYISNKVSFLILISNIIIITTGIFLKEYIALYMIWAILLLSCIVMLTEEFADYVGKCLEKEKNDN